MSHKWLPISPYALLQGRIKHKQQYSQQIPRLVGEQMGTYMIYMIIYYITNDISNSGIVSLSLGIVKDHINILFTELEVNVKWKTQKPNNLGHSMAGQHESS